MNYINACIYKTILSVKEFKDKNIWKMCLVGSNIQLVKRGVNFVYINKILGLYC